MTVLPDLATACLIDNVASLWANGLRAALNPTPPRDLAHLAPFTIPRAFASGRPVQLSESRTDLVRSLPAATVAAPYRWSLGDGAGPHSSAHLRPSRTVQGHSSWLLSAAA